MGYGNFSDAVYSSVLSSHKTAGTDPFVHDADIRAGRVDAGVHELLDPKGLNKSGRVVRESRDSALHPESVAVTVFFDETGSMGTIPRRLKDKLGTLMSVLVKKGFLEHPHILFGAFGDANGYERAPFQVGQFEGGNEIDEALSHVYLEGQGGGTHQESSEIPMYFMARHAEMDCLEIRGKKGYMFIISDETPYDRVKKSQVALLIGDNLQADIPLEDKYDETTKELLETGILTELREKFEVFWIRPDEGSYTGDPGVTGKMQAMFGQNWLALERTEDVVELIAATIGIAEGFDIHDIADGLKDAGADPASVGRASTALAAYAAKAGSMTRPVTTDTELATTGDDSVTRT